MSEATERQFKILIALSQRRHDTISNLAFEFHVSERTIRRDIDTLCHIAPIYAKPGRYPGGIYTVDGYFVNKVYLLPEQEHLLKSIIECAKNGQPIVLNDMDVKRLLQILDAFSLPRR